MLKLKLAANPDHESESEESPKKMANVDEGLNRNSDAAESAPAWRLRGATRQEAQNSPPEVSFCDRTRPKNETICPCAAGPIRSSPFEVLDLLALVFDVRICVLEISQFGEIVGRIRFGRSRSRLAVCVAQRLRLDPKFTQFRSELLGLLGKYDESGKSPNAGLALEIQDRLRRIERMLSDHRNFAFAVPNLKGNQKQSNCFEAEFDWNTQQTQKNNLYASFLDKIGRRGIHPLSPSETFASRNPQKQNRTGSPSLRFGLAICRGLRELVALSFAESGSVHRVTCKRFRASDIDLNWPTKRVVSFPCFARFRRRVNWLFCNAKHGGDSKSAGGQKDCAKRISALVYSETKRRNHFASRTSRFKLNFKDFIVHGSGNFDNIFSDPSTKKHQIITFRVESKWFKKKPKPAVEAGHSQKKSDQNDTGSDRAKQAQHPGSSRDSNATCSKQTPSGLVRSAKSASKTQILENKVFARALLSEMPKSQRQKQIYRHRFLQMIRGDQERPSRPKTPKRPLGGRSGRFESEVYPNWTIPVEKSRLSTFGAILGEPVKSGSSHRFPVSFSERVDSKTWKRM